MSRILKFMSLLLVLVIVGCPNMPESKKETKLGQTASGEPMASPSSTPIVPGSQVPDVTLTNLEGESVSLISLLNAKPESPSIFMFATTSCPFCQDEFANVQGTKDTFGDQVKVVTILVNETPDSARKFMETNKVPGKVLVDPEAKAAAAYSVKSVPTLMITDASNVLNYMGNFTPQKDLMNMVARIRLGRSIREIRPGGG